MKLRNNDNVLDNPQKDFHFRDKCRDLDMERKSDVFEHQLFSEGQAHARNHIGRS